MRLTVPIALVGLLAAAVATPAQSTWSRSAVNAILLRYATGDYAEAIHGVEGLNQGALQERLTPDTPDNAFTTWDRAARDWIRLGSWPTGLRRRQLVAATVALEIAHAHPEFNFYARLRFFSWACDVVRDHPAGNDVERLWYLTSIAVMQEAGPLGFLPAARDDMSLRVARERADHDEVAAGHLAHAIAAFPNETRFRLADAWARAALTSVTTYSASHNWMQANEIPVKNPPADREQAKRLAERLATLPSIERDLQALTGDQQLRDEAELNLGYLAVRQQRWDEAIAHLDRVAPSTKDLFLVCMSHYLRGWVFQRTNRRDEAIAEYRVALAASPKARSISIMLADQLAQAGLQGEAYQVLDAGFKASLAAADPRIRISARGGPAGPSGTLAFVDRRSDPWEQFQHGDARMIPAFFAQLREALK